MILQRVALLQELLEQIHGALDLLEVAGLDRFDDGLDGERDRLLEGVELGAVLERERVLQRERQERDCASTATYI